MGDDLVVGGESTDDISGGWGDDALRSRDGSGNDSVSCGPNLDFAEVDVGDSVSGDCEDVERF